MALLKQTTALHKISSLTRRLRIIQGGTSASKTFSILAYLIHVAQTNLDILISVVSESMPHFRLGAIRDFGFIMKAQRYWEEGAWSTVYNTYTFPNGATIEFFSVDSSKAHGPRRDVLFLNECNNVSYEIYTQLETRTRELIILDYNPTSEFWVHTEVMPHNVHDFLKLTYRDNEALAPVIVRSIESRMHDTNYWRVYGLGEIGILEGVIYDNWEQVEGVPAGATLLRHTLDFGFTNDPFAIVDVYRYQGGFLLDEQLYLTDQKNKALANALRRAEGLAPAAQDGNYVGRIHTLTIGDSSEPKSIAEIRDYGVTITGAVKGPDSIDYGIQLVQQQKLYVTARSVNLIKELRNYVRKVDKKTGKSLNVPIDDWNHALDAVRYGIADVLSAKKTSSVRVV
ncbi:terminase [Rathayibacter sp. VKM Ac-2856]|uniref:PBSX family phage terminase large subunit n=1 Tax=unclassified Rathayibacter TaxID=2609250 RepID=UPI0015630604|nr:MULTISPECIES: terminase large subunit [unclassified Rathayibacter]NQX03690.1 terminase [Rathayibacter sp. VKM Ac-2858]NQX18858.1 terminase [Rathayibacter sp. VKM Ac-2856]